MTHLVKTDNGNGLHLYNDHKNEGEDSRWGGGCWVRRQKRKGWEVGVLNGWEAGEVEVNIIFAIKKDLKGGSQGKRVRN